MCILFRVLFGLPVRTPFDISIRFPFRLPFGCVPSRFPFRLTLGRQSFEVKAASRPRRPDTSVFVRDIQIVIVLVSLLAYLFVSLVVSFRLSFCFPFRFLFGFPFRIPSFPISSRFSAHSLFGPQIWTSKRTDAHDGPKHTLNKKTNLTFKSAIVFVSILVSLVVSLFVSLLVSLFASIFVSLFVSFFGPQSLEVKTASRPRRPETYVL